MARAKKPAPAASSYTLKVTLLGSAPPIWRTVQVRGDTTLGRLHRVLQAAFGWEDCHPHQFVVGQRRFGVPERADFGPPVTDERKATVAELAPKRGKRFVYEYDFGDGWEHGVEVEAIAAPVGGLSLPRLLDGARAAPPEDSGGVWGYAQKLEAIAGEQHPEHDDVLEWLGEGFDPEAFDVKQAAAAVARVR